MKVKLLTLILTAGVLSVGATGANAMTDMVVSAITNAVDNPSNVETLCRKGQAISGTFSIRSLEGRACNQPVIAAFAEILCTPGNHEKYTDSQCHKNALAALGGKTPIAVLSEAVGDTNSFAYGIFCGQKHNFPAGGVMATVAATCPAAK